jgi:hypothetical protein
MEPIILVTLIILVLLMTRKFKGNSDQEFYANVTWNWGHFKNNDMMRH